ncbi:PIG-L deacetylase family protein [Nocardioides rubriscoriae]|uniref:PIG-L deacetylase family protein n=1 Tax=Nocardioides rubriscoriae TaxID=642762 RepID=UPI0011DF4138|nr:PIG-L deacetylase family protein [Nocardioides rubriscoriae]
MLRHRSEDTGVLPARSARGRRGAVSRLVVAPHCDDETLGCGGLLAKYPGEIAVVVLAQPDEVRFKEFEVAREILGYAPAHFLGLKDGSVGEDMHRLVGLLDRVVADLRPDELYLPFPSMHQDHIAAYEAGIRAGRLSMSEGHWFTPSLYVYDVAAYDVTLYPTNLEWNMFEALDEECIDKKVDALSAYSSQAVTGPHPINSVKQQASVIGHARQVNWAEPYSLVRGVRV